MRVKTSATSALPEIFGTRMASGPASQTAARSSAPQDVSSALIRTTTSRFANTRSRMTPQT